MISVTLAVCLGCWAIHWFFAGSHTASAPPAPLQWSRANDWLQNGPFACPAGILLLCLMGIMVQYASSLQTIVQGKTALPFLLFLLFGSTGAGFAPLQVTSAACLFLMPGMYELFRGYKVQMAPGNACKVMLWLAAGSLLWIHLLWLAPLVWYGMYRFQSLNVRNFIASLLGLLTPYWLLLGVCMWRHDFAPLLTAGRLLFSFKACSLAEFLQLQRLAAPASAFVLLLIIDVHLRIRGHEANLRTQQFIRYLSMCAKYTVLFPVLFGEQAYGFLCVFYMQVSLLLSHVFSLASRRYAILCYILLILSLLTLWGLQWSSGL
jgi:hypothetical protein